MVRKLLLLFLLLFIISACKSNKFVENDNITAVIKDNLSDNKSSNKDFYDNKSIQKEHDNETVIDIFTNINGRLITKIYISDSKNTLADEKNKELLQHLLKYNNNKCVNWIYDALKYNYINNNIADTYIQYDNIYLYNPSVLHIAVMCENIDVIKLLIDFGADIFAEDGSGETISALAEKMNNEEIIEIIIKEYENGFK